MPQRSGYWQATRHPWPCLLFLLPLLLVYELGVFWLNAANPDALRNGADSWLRWGLEAFGFGEVYAAPGLVLVILLIWSLARMRDRPADCLGVWAGMVLESVLVAVLLWGMSRGLKPFLYRVGLAVPASPASRLAAYRIITYVGAGIYEEVLFRLGVFSILFGLCRFVDVPALVALALSAAASAALFAAAHHIGPYGEPFHRYAFLFRTLAGVYFALVFWIRGFGIVVGAHAFYDVLVGSGVA